LRRQDGGVTARERNASAKEKPCRSGQGFYRPATRPLDQHLGGQTGPQQSAKRFSHFPAFVQTKRLHQPDGLHSTVQTLPAGEQALPANDIFFLAAKDASVAKASARQATAAITAIFMGILQRSIPR
jgi:hypothetical protein